MTLPENQSVRPSLPPADELDAYFIARCESIKKLYPRRKTYPNLLAYTHTLLHEVGHALMAYEHGVTVCYISVHPWEGGGAANIYEVITNKGDLHDSAVAARIFVAGYCLDWMFHKQADQLEICARHDLWYAKMCLERGELAANLLDQEYRRQLKSRSVLTREEMAEAMRAACIDMLATANDDWVKPLRCPEEADTALRQILKETFEWALARRPAIAYLVKKIARLNKKEACIWTDDNLFHLALKQNTVRKL